MKKLVCALAAVICLAACSDGNEDAMKLIRSVPPAPDEGSFYDRVGYLRNTLPVLESIIEKYPKSAVALSLLKGESLDGINYIQLKNDFLNFQKYKFTSLVYDKFNDASVYIIQSKDITFSSSTLIEGENIALMIGSFEGFHSNPSVFLLNISEELDVVDTLGVLYIRKNYQQKLKSKEGSDGKLELTFNAEAVGKNLNSNEWYVASRDGAANGIPARIDEPWRTISREEMANGPLARIRFEGGHGPFSRLVMKHGDIDLAIGNGDSYPDNIDDIGIIKLNGSLMTSFLADIFVRSIRGSGTTSDGKKYQCVFERISSKIDPDFGKKYLFDAIYEAEKNAHSLANGDLSSGGFFSSIEDSFASDAVSFQSIIKELAENISSCE